MSFENTDERKIFQAAEAALIKEAKKLKLSKESSEERLWNQGVGHVLLANASAYAGVPALDAVEKVDKTLGLMALSKNQYFSTTVAVLSSIAQSGKLRVTTTPIGGSLNRISIAPALDNDQLYFLMYASPTLIRSVQDPAALAIMMTEAGEHLRSLHTKAEQNREKSAEEQFAVFNSDSLSDVVDMKIKAIAIAAKSYITFYGLTRRIVRDRKLAEDVLEFHTNGSSDSSPGWRAYVTQRVSRNLPLGR